MGKQTRLTKRQQKAVRLNLFDPNKPRKQRKKKKRKNKRRNRNTTPPTVGTWWSDLLKQAGFDSYDGPGGYLESRLWAGIRKTVLDEQDHTCKACGNGASQVHHRWYNLPVLLGDDLTPMVAICRSCHGKIHIDPKGNKRTLRQANTELDRLITKPAQTWIRRSPVQQSKTPKKAKKIQQQMQRNRRYHEKMCES